MEGAPPGPPALADRVMHAPLRSDRGHALMASDNAPGMPYNPGNTITCSLSGDPDESPEQVWEKLSAGGTVTTPSQKQMWGDLFGMCTDKFGTPWMVDIPNRSDPSAAAPGIPDPLGTADTLGADERTHLPVC
jgi:PhnB protein